MIYLEIFGYVGTALVLLSMMMTSVVKLRLYNTIGSIISMIYSFLCNAWPVVFLNLGLIIINIYQLIRLQRSRVVFTHITVDPNDKIFAYFLAECSADIVRYFPNYRYTPNPRHEIHMVFDEVEPIGVMIGVRKCDTFVVDLDYVTKKYRDCSVAQYLFEQLKKTGVTQMVESGNSLEHKEYLKKMGFVNHNTQFIKDLGE